MEKSLYPPEVEIIKNLTGASEIKETHISYAILGKEYVYKIKKSVDFGFLDYRLLQSRRSYCILEKELNDRFSKGIYLQVLKLIKRSHGVFELVPVESTLSPIEYVLKMKRIDDGDFLSSRIAEGKILYKDMVHIGSSVANLLKNLDNAPKDDDFKEPFDSVRFNALENFSQTEKYSGSFIDSDAYSFIKNKTEEFLEKNRDIFNKRAADGFVKNGHGDLRLEHIYFNSDNTIGLIDCIEFNKRFRYMDVIAEAAFLSMELDSSGLIDFSDGFIEGFLSIFSDDTSKNLINYYRCYLAYVRAKVTCFLLDGKDENWAEYEKKKSEVKRLIDMSAYYALCMDKPQTLLFYGIMGTGKSKNAKNFAERFPVFRINSDEARKTNAGIPVYEKNYCDFGKGVYSKENSILTYKNMASNVASKISIGRGCIVDASFTDSLYLDEFKKLDTGILRYFQFTATDDVIMERLKARLDKDVVSDGRPEIYYSQKESANMPDPEIVVETTGSVSENAEKIFKTLIKLN